jgi:hypothetical protein
MGQGVHTGLATVVAEELDADFDAIQVVDAANGATGEQRQCLGLISAPCVVALETVIMSRGTVGTR